MEIMTLLLLPLWPKTLLPSPIPMAYPIAQIGPPRPISGLIGINMKSRMMKISNIISNPTLVIKLTPRLGSFSIRKSVSKSSKMINGGATDGENSYTFVSLDQPINWNELSVESAEKGIMVAVDTELPNMKRVKGNLRWGVGVLSDFEKKLSYLRVNKIKVQRIDDVIEEEVD